MGLNPFGQSCVSRVASFLRGEVFVGNSQSEAIPEFEHRPSVSSKMLVKLASKWAVDPHRAMSSSASVPPVAGLPPELVL
ncbi:hypothetical protein SLA2020_280840 [Shorea laevis]